MVDGAEIWVASLPLQALTSPPAPLPITDAALVGVFLAAELFFDTALLTTTLLLVENAEV